jgi:hypothetical protein
MASQFTARYVRDVEERMQGFYQTLSEKDRRRYAAVEARKLGRGGVSYVAEVLGCSTRTIERAARELDQLPNDPAAGRVRQAGGGRKKRSPPSHSSNRI